MKRLILILFLVPLVSYGWTPWGTALKNTDETITGAWTFQDTTTFNGLAIFNLVEIDTLTVNYINSVYVDADSIVTNDFIFPDADQGANLGKASRYWNLGYIDSLLMNYTLLPLNGKVIWGDGSTYWTLSNDDVLDLYVNSALAGRFSANSFTWGGEVNLGDAITDTAVFAGVIQIPDEGKIFFNSALDNYLYTPGNDTIDWFINGRKLLKMTSLLWRYAPNGGADTNFQLLLPMANDATTPTFAFGDGDAGFFEYADDNLRVSLNGSAFWTMNTTVMGNANSQGSAINQTIASATVPGFILNKSDGNTGLGWAGADSLSLISGGVEIMRLPEGGRNYPQAMAGGIDLIEQSSLPGTIIAGTIMVANDSLFISFNGSTFVNVVTQARKAP